MNNLLQDLRFALRHLRRSPGFAVTAVFILALGIAANVIVFGVLQTIILQPLDVPRADRVVTFATKEQGYPIYSYPEIRDVRDGNTVFSGVAAYEIDMFGLEASGVTRPASGDTKQVGSILKSWAQNLSSGDCCVARMTIIPAPQKWPSSAGRRGNIRLAPIPISWAG